MKKLTAVELPRLRRIGREFAAVSKVSGGFCESHFEDFWKTILSTDSGAIFYDENQSGEIIGVFGGLFCASMFSGWKLAAESFWFVLPEARGKSLSLRLLKAFEDEAIVRKRQEILMVSLVACDPEVVNGILIRHGYSASEIIHRKVL